MQFEAQFKTLAGQGGEGGRNDLLVYIHADDVGKFALWRLQYGMSWWEDYVVNNASIIPERIKAKYTSRWKLLKIKCKKRLTQVSLFAIINTVKQQKEINYANTYNTVLFRRVYSKRTV